MDNTVRRSTGKIVLLAGIFALLLLLAGFAFGSLRYGGPDGLILRVRVALAQRSGPAVPPPPFVPTPLPTPIGSQSLALLATDPTSAPGPTAQVMTTGSRAQHAPTVPFAAVESLPDRPTATTPLPTATPAPPTATPATAAGSAFVQLSGLAHYWQTWNNCGPATLAMNLSYYGLPLSQKQTAAVLKPNWDDKNVSPHEMADYARSQGLSALVRVNGTAELLRRYVDAGILTSATDWIPRRPIPASAWATTT